MTSTTMDWKAVPIGPKSHKVKRTHQPSWSAAALGNKSANLQNKPKMTFKLQSTNIKTQPSKQSKETPVPPPQVPGQKSMNSATRSNVFKDTVETSVVEGVEEISVEKDVAETGALESASVVGIVRYSDANKLRPGESPVPLPNRDSHQPHSPQHAAEYLGDILPPQCVPPPRADIDFLGKLPCKRRLPPAYSASIEADSWEPMLYAIALAYIVGDEVTSPSMICNEGLKLPRSSPLAAKCISLPRSMPPELRQLFSKFETCVGCKHWTKIARQKNPCKWGRMTWAKKDDLKEAEPVEMDTDSTEPTDIAEPTDVESDVVALSSRATTPVAEAKLRRARKQSMRLQKLAHTTSRQASLEASQASTPPQVEKVARVDPWTMEDWEVCPGTIRSIDSDQTIAFSNAYLTSHKDIEVSPDVFIRVLVIKPGQTQCWEIDHHKVKTCTVASGKILLKHGSHQQPQNLGPNSMFIIRPGQSCRAENRLYVDVTIHCTIVSNYELRG